MWAVVTRAIGSGCRLGRWVGSGSVWVYEILVVIVQGEGQFGWIQCRNGVLIDYRLMCAKLTIFPYAEFIVKFCEGLAFLWCSQVQDRTRGRREIHVQTRAKSNKTNATWRYTHAANSYGQAVILLRHSLERHMDAYVQSPSWAESYSARLVLNDDSMLGLCDPSTFLLFEYLFYLPRSDVLFSNYFEDLLWWCVCWLQMTATRKPQVDDKCRPYEQRQYLEKK